MGKIQQEKFFLALQELIKLMFQLWFRLKLTRKSLHLKF